METKQPDILAKLAEQDAKIDDIQKNVRAMKRIFQWTMIVSLILFVVPLIGLLFVIPSYLKTLNLSNYGL